eukprot:snap_masked-scaffold829_size91079-processed-gene-0.5 protein:Tk01796 transcript:snap_masked-scaffold829_size91079-processed-gene-0.5-mRNA-1 annotation:"hypothetical protein DAPPUDRAFT_308023"
MQLGVPSYRLVLEVLGGALSLFMVATASGDLAQPPTAFPPCPSQSGWFQCPNSSVCISPSQQCDGQIDCFEDGSDESRELCANKFCETGVRCRRDPICIRVPHRHVCNQRRSLCSDGSDTAHCMHKIFTGCLLSEPKLGLILSSCDECFCQLKTNRTTPTSPLGDSQPGVLIYKSISPSHRGSHIRSVVCLPRSSPKICDGSADCIHGEDEDPSLCGPKRSGSEGQFREGKGIPIVSWDEAEEQVEREESQSNRSAILSSQILSPMRVNTWYFLLGIMLMGGLLIYIVVTMVVYSCRGEKEAKRGSNKTKRSARRDDEILINDTASTKAWPSSQENLSLPEAQGSEGDDDEGAYNRTIGAPVNSKWTWNGARMVRDIGRGFYGQVYLAEELSGRLVAVKTVDRNRRQMVDGVFRNEIESLQKVGRHVNIVKLVGYNHVKEILVFEYCQSGSLKSYVRQNRNFFIDEIEPLSGELSSSAYLRRPPSIGDNLPMSDFLISLHTKLDPDSPSPALQEDRHLFNTRMLLRWTGQIAKAMDYLAQKQIVHGDLAMRNVLLTSSDIVKLSDFGLARDLRQPYWVETGIGHKSLPAAWMAPECLENPESLALSSDVWSFGVVLWELFSLGEQPYFDSIGDDLEHLLPKVKRGLRLQPPQFMPRSIHGLLNLCFNIAEDQRPDFAEIRHHLVEFWRSPQNYSGERPLKGFHSAGTPVGRKYSPPIRSRTDSGIYSRYSSAGSGVRPASVASTLSTRLYSLSSTVGIRDPDDLLGQDEFGYVPMSSNCNPPASEAGSGTRTDSPQPRHPRQENQPNFPDQDERTICYWKGYKMIRQTKPNCGIFFRFFGPLWNDLNLDRFIKSACTSVSPGLNISIDDSSIRSMQASRAHLAQEDSSKPALHGDLGGLREAPRECIISRTVDATQIWFGRTANN